MRNQLLNVITKKLAPVIKNDQSIFPELISLNPIEKEIFNSNVKRNIRKMLDWGKVSEEEFMVLKENLRILADRGVADDTRTLMNLSKSNPLSREQSADSINSLDTISYLARRKHPISIQALLLLASRPVEFNGDKTFVDPVISTITFEAFQGFSSVDKATAIDVIKHKTNLEQKLFIYHFIIGRTLAGLSKQNAIEEVKKEFGIEILSDIGLQN